MVKKPRRPALVLDVMICHFPYGGNGGIATEVPAIRKWEVQTVLKAKKDPRVGEIRSIDIADTPITMTRNRAVRIAQEWGAHVLIMIDSDQNPLRHANEPWHKPFWDVAFDELYNHYQKGPLVIGAPYCGPPPYENVYLFQFESNMSGIGDETEIQMQQFNRPQAAAMTGVGEVAALPTGLTMWDMRIFDIVKPSGKMRRQVLEELVEGKLTIKQALRELSEGWFYYEWKDGYADEKASTEDVASTRDIGMVIQDQLGYNPLRCAWDSWIGHIKPWDVGKPLQYNVDNVARTFRAVVEGGLEVTDRVMDFRSDIMDELARREIRFPETPVAAPTRENGQSRNHARRAKAKR